MYPLIGCDMIQMSTAKMPEYSNRKDGYTDIYFDEEFLLKGEPVVNGVTMKTMDYAKLCDKNYDVVLNNGIIGLFTKHSMI